MFGRYFHALTAHSALVNRIISLQLLNAEVEERTFGQCKAITKATSNEHTEHIIKTYTAKKGSDCGVHRAPVHSCATVLGGACTVSSCTREDDEPGDSAGV